MDNIRYTNAKSDQRIGHRKRMISSVLILQLLAIATLGACSSGPQTSTSNVATPKSDKGDEKKRDDKDSKPTMPANTDTSAESAACDKTLWDHVYNPERLQVQKDCMAVKGTITERSTDDDGDEHMLLKLDDGQDELLTKKNKKKKEGDLVIEAVCAGQPKLPKVGEVCRNFSNHVTLPQVGDHVRVTGSYVLDTHNGWAEIHPVSSIEHK